MNEGPATPDSADDEPRYPIRRERNIRIPMPDGVTLAADCFRPDAPGRYPVVIEYLPYRKNDTTWEGWYGHRYLAERGYVSVRIDVRGSGDSEGQALDEYCEQEQLDGVAAIAWLAEQPWSNGYVGMFGTSYGGFNSLQVAMHRPPALKAICPMYFTDNRYTDDCHYKGGQLQMLYDVGTYGLSMVGRNMLPPRPDLVGEQWGEIWEEHLPRTSRRQFRLRGDIPARRRPAHRSDHPSVVRSGRGTSSHHVLARVATRPRSARTRWSAVGLPGGGRSAGHRRRSAARP